MALLRLDVVRMRAALRRPSGTFWIGTVLPALLLAVGVVAIGRIGDAQLQSTQDGVTLGVLIGAPLAFVTYTVLLPCTLPWPPPKLRRTRPCPCNFAMPRLV